MTHWTDDLIAAIKERRPETIFRETDPLWTLASLLDDNFPIPGGWNVQSIEDSARTLRKHYPLDARRHV